MTRVIDTFPTQYYSEGFRVLDKEHGEHVLLEVDYYLGDGFSTIVYRTSQGQLYLEIEAELTAESLSKVAKLDMTEVITQEKFSIHFRELNYKMRKIYDEHSILMEYRPDWGRVHLKETQKEEELISRLWFICAQCSGEPLIYYANTEGEHFYQGTLVEEVTPQKFLQVAGQWYLSSISRQSITLLNQLKNEIGFPVLAE